MQSELIQTLFQQLTPPNKRLDDPKLKRLANIEWIQSLDRTGLEFNIRERRLLIRRTRSGEMLFIQFPGKESSNEDDSRRRPWDFRPKLVRRDGSFFPDLSFSAIWDLLFEIRKRPYQDYILAAVASLFFRMAYMADHKLSPADALFAADDMLESKSSPKVAKSHSILSVPAGPRLYGYSPPRDALAMLDELIGDLNGASLEAFLHYNDLLAWNEDCKYFYRDSLRGKRGYIHPSVGRPNNLMTHVNVIGLLLHKVSFSKVLGGASNGKGVSPCSQKTAKEIYHLLLK